MILENSRKTILVADQHKFGRRAMSRMGHISDLDMLVTDAPLKSNYQALCDASDVSIHIAAREPSE